MKPFKEDGPNYNWGYSKGEFMSKFLVIYINTSDDSGFQFYQAVLIQKVFEAPKMDHCNGLSTPTKVETPLVKDVNGSEAKRDWPDSYTSVIGMML